MSDLVERLRWHSEDQATGKLRLTNPDGPEAADEIERLQAQVAALRAALVAVDYAAHQLCVALDVDPDETFIRVKNSRTDEVLARKSLSDIFVQVCAALEGK